MLRYLKKVSVLGICFSLLSTSDYVHAQTQNDKSVSPKKPRTFVNVDEIRVLTEKETYAYGMAISRAGFRGDKSFTSAGLGIVNGKKFAPFADVSPGYNSIVNLALARLNSAEAGAKWLNVKILAEVKDNSQLAKLPSYTRSCAARVLSQTYGRNGQQRFDLLKKYMDVTVIEINEAEEKWQKIKKDYDHPPAQSKEWWTMQMLADMIYINHDKELYNAVKSAGIDLSKNDISRIKTTLAFASDEQRIDGIIQEIMAMKYIKYEIVDMLADYDKQARDVVIAKLELFDKTKSKVNSTGFHGLILVFCAVGASESKEFLKNAQSNSFYHEASDYIQRALEMIDAPHYATFFH
jgi:hypothetical protein